LPYATLLSRKGNGRDVTIFSADGVVSYDAVGDRYIAGTKEKLDGLSEVGTQMIYSNTDGSVRAQGGTDLGLELQMVELKAAGDMWKTTKDSTYTFDMVIALGFLATKSVWGQMAKDLQSWTFSEPAVDIDGEKMQRHLAMMMPDQAAADKLLNNLNMTGTLSLPAEDRYNLVVSAKMIWDANEKTFRSAGPVGIISVGGKAVTRTVKGYLELGMARSGDFVNLYLEPSPEEWYFINYRKNEFGLFSSNEVFNNEVKATPDNSRLFKGATEQDFLIFEIGSRATMVRFVKNMQYFESLLKN
jgi:hypothetical protein